VAEVTAPTGPLLVDVPLPACTGGLIGRLKALLAAHRGTQPVVVRLIADGGPTHLRLGEEFRVDGSPGLLFELRRLLGQGAVRTVVEDTTAVPGAPLAAAVR
jgi:DNA polymerase-3 subunit alpha